MIVRIQSSERDRAHLSLLAHTTGASEEDSYDYSRVMIPKPWGMEYLAFQNKDAAVWVLHLDSGQRTSLHAHPRKKTSLVVLAGKARCATLNTEPAELEAGQGLLMEKGVFHSTEAIGPKGLIVMEVETPVNKKDLVRLDDRYGRQGQGYEQAHLHLPREASLHHFHGPEDQYGMAKRVGECALTLVRCQNDEEFSRIASSMDADVVSVLAGALRGRTEGQTLEIGDAIAWDLIRSASHVIPEGQAELLFIKKLSQKL